MIQDSCRLPIARASPKSATHSSPRLGPDVERTAGEDPSDTAPQPDAVSPVADRERHGPTRCGVTPRCLLRRAAMAAAPAAYDDDRQQSPTTAGGGPTGTRSSPPTDRPSHRARAASSAAGSCASRTSRPCTSRSCGTAARARSASGAGSTASGWPDRGRCDRRSSTEAEVELLVLGRPLQVHLVVPAGIDHGLAVEGTEYTVSTSSTARRCNGTVLGRCRTATR